MILRVAMVVYLVFCWAFGALLLVGGAVAGNLQAVVAGIVFECVSLAALWDVLANWRR
jgi:hypothetical protein